MGALQLRSGKVTSFRNLSEMSSNGSSLGKRHRRWPNPFVHFVAARVLVVMVIVERRFSRLLKSWKEVSVGHLRMPQALCQGCCHRAPQDVWVKRQTSIVSVLEARAQAGVGAGPSEGWEGRTCPSFLSLACT